MELSDYVRKLSKVYFSEFVGSRFFSGISISKLWKLVSVLGVI